MQYKLNSAITEKELRNYGFTDWSNGHWYLCKNLYKNEISLNLDILKVDYGHVEIDVLDENVGQPYNYDWLLSVNKNAKTANKVKKAYDKIMKKLLKDEILLEVKDNE